MAVINTQYQDPAFIAWLLATFGYTYNVNAATIVEIGRAHV